MIERYRTVLGVLAPLALAACDLSIGPDPDASIGTTDFDPATCDLPRELLLPVVDWDAIPSIDEPSFVEPEHEFAAYLNPDDRVIGVVLGDEVFAVPHNVLWSHEIVNLDTDIGSLAVTYCPLTGSSMAFSRDAIEGRGFGVSGFLFQNNLVMFDRDRRRSTVWVQMQANAACGPQEGTGLIQWPVVEMRWDSWLELHPSTLVMSEQQGFGRDYTAEGYPYGDYESLSSEEFLYPLAMPELDRRRPVKERVLGIPGLTSRSGLAFPFEALIGLPGELQVVEFAHLGSDAVVLWSDVAEGGMAYRPRTNDGDDVDLEAAPEGFVDRATGSVFTVDGRAISGPLEGTTLVAINDAYVAFWGAWAAFRPDTELWEGGGA